ncbi:MAG: hypothetical protein ACJ71W_21805 [Terriglobales bacterium]
MSANDNYKNASAFLAVHKIDGGGNLMYILIDDRDLFNLIDIPERGNARVRHKAIYEGKQHIIFQFWIKGFQKLDDAFGLMAYQFKNLAAATSVPA